MGLSNKAYFRHMNQYRQANPYHDLPWRHQSPHSPLVLPELEGFGYWEGLARNLFYGLIRRTELRGFLWRFLETYLVT